MDRPQMQTGRVTYYWLDGTTEYLAHLSRHGLGRPALYPITDPIWCDPVSLYVLQ